MCQEPLCFYSNQTQDYNNNKKGYEEIEKLEHKKNATELNEDVDGQVWGGRGGGGKDRCVEVEKSETDV